MHRINFHWRAKPADELLNLEGGLFAAVKISGNKVRIDERL